MLRFRLLQSNGELTAEGLELTDGRVVVVAARVSGVSKLYSNREKMADDWGATIEWVDAPEAE